MVVDIRFKGPVALVPTAAAPLRVVCFISAVESCEGAVISESRHVDGTLCTRSG